MAKISLAEALLAMAIAAAFCAVNTIERSALIERNGVHLAFKKHCCGWPFEVCRRPLVPGVGRHWNWPGCAGNLLVLIAICTVAIAAHRGIRRVFPWVP